MLESTLEKLSLELYEYVFVDPSECPKVNNTIVLKSPANSFASFPEEINMSKG